MKRVLAALAALMVLANSADAKTLVVWARTLNGSEIATEGTDSHNREVRMLSSILNRVTSGPVTGYRMVDSNRCKTEWARLGQMVWGANASAAVSAYSSAATVESYDAVILVGLDMLSLGGSVCRLDSILMVSRGGPRVPILAILNDTKLVAGASLVLSSSACSTGVTAQLVGDGGSTSGYVLHKIGSPRGWSTAGSFISCAAPGDVGSAGFRNLVGLNEGSLVVMNLGLINSAWPDSMANFAANDSTVLWELPFANVNGAKHAVLCWPDGVGGPNDSTGLKDIAEVDPSIIMMGLARLDSLSGGNVFDRNKLPLKLAPTVDGAFRWESSNRAYPSIFPADSTIFKATLDSIAKINAAGGVPIRLTVGAWADSVAARGFERKWWDKVAAWVRFSPQDWTGQITTAVETNANASTSNAIDPFGRKRNRVIYGDYGGVDTSTVSLLRAGKSLLAQFYPSQLSSCALPVMDDWSPKNKEGSAYQDSMFYALGKAGFTCVRADGRSWAGEAGRMQNGVAMTTATPYGYTTAGALGYTQRQERYREPFGGNVITVLDHPGYCIAPVTSQWSSMDSVSVPIGANIGPLFDEANRTWLAFLCDRDEYNGDAWSLYGYDRGGLGPTGYYGTMKNTQWIHDDIERRPGRGYILRLTAAQLSGDASQHYGPPSRIGLWQLKNIKYQFDTINDFAGRTVCTFDYPENIDPR